MGKFLLVILSSFMLLSCTDPSVKMYKLDVVAEYAHDTEAYTQGLFFEDGQMYESTGRNGASSFRKVDLVTGEVLDIIRFDDKYFIEGSVMFGDNLYILTWETNTAFVYDAKTLKYKTTWKYPREGWGLTHDGKNLIASDGSSVLYFMDENFKVERKVVVKYEGRPVRWLNELEYIDGKIWANVYTSDFVVIIDPKSGVVEGVIDFRGLISQIEVKDDTDVFNGIAYDAATKRIFVTGKLWNKLFEVELVKR